MRGFPVRATLAVLAATLVTLFVTAAGIPAGAQERTGGGRSRLRPPEGFACAPNDLTVYTGVVTRYTRTSTRTTLLIRTDWDTTEFVTVRYRAEGPAAHYRYEGRPFTKEDWPRIESSPRVLRKGMRASAWVCADGTVLVDWGVPKE